MRCNACLTIARKWYLLIAILLFSGFINSNVEATNFFTINVVDSEGNPISTGFRWLVEEDPTYPVEQGNFDIDNTVSVQFHKSHAPVKMEGESNTSSVEVRGGQIKNRQRYFVSVLPYSGYTMSGAPRDAMQREVTIVVNQLPIPTAQISVFVFEDNQPINNAPDLPQERGLGGFSIKVLDAAGMYGIAGGQVMLDAFGNPLNPVETDENGLAVIKNLAPGKYGIEIVPPAGQGWVQTTTIEGGKTIDAWVKANEPPFLVEFGSPQPHVFFGFVQPINDGTELTGAATITGEVVNKHSSRLPAVSFHDGTPFPSCWVGLNNLAVGQGKGIYAQPCNGDSTFSIPNVPPGQYQMVIWDDNLDIIIAFQTVTVPTAVTQVDLGKVQVFNWFARMEHYVFLDLNEDGFRDPGEQGIREQAINLRFRDGRVYQSFPTDNFGFAPFDEVFPFFHWLVAEVDFARFKATGATITVDAGGAIDPAEPYSFGGVLNPQPQSENGNLPYRTETGPVLTQAFQGFLGQTSVIEWGKAPYGPGENGGISGIVYYATTRAENDPRFAAAEEWEPGIPRVQVNLYQDFDLDGIIDDLDLDGKVTLADVDNYPFGNFPGREDIDRNRNGNPDLGDALNVTWTDSWDDSVPTGCQGDVFMIDGVIPTDCYDGLRNFNQVRPGVFDGGYAFDGLPSGIYIVEAALPAGYEHVKEEDRNVDFGEEYTPISPQLLAPGCVGDLRTIPDYFSFVTDKNGNLLPGYDPAESAAPFAGGTRPLCDRKQITLTSGKNAAVDFFMFTDTPKAAHVVGIMLNDLANEFDLNSANFGEKFAPPFLPVGFYDWKGNPITRIYSDRWGKFNAMLPSTYTMNLPMPSGVSPNMLIACMNDPGIFPNPSFNPNRPNSSPISFDPYFDPRYSQTCYTLQYMPGSTTYLDTPVIPIAAFAGESELNPLDCEQPNRIPLIYSVSGPDGGSYAEPGQIITIESVGRMEVPNPDYDGVSDLRRTIQRDYRFGSQRGTVTIAGQALNIMGWNQRRITAIIPAGTPTGQIIITRANGEQSPVGVTVTIGPLPAGRNIHHVSAGALGTTPIQDAIDAAAPGDLILLEPGVYSELVIMYKPVQLQGSGAFSTIISAHKFPTDKLQIWRDKIEQLHNNGDFDILPGQGGGFNNLGPNLFSAEEGPGIIVVAKQTGPNRFRASPNARIDGLTVTGANQGGGVFVNGYAKFLEISNNRIYSNHGTLGGGIRIGHPNLTDGGDYTDGENDRIKIHHNHIAQNGSSGNLGEAGAGVSLYTGTDRYEVTENFICGNFSQGKGAGIGHLGLSKNGLIGHNTIIFNQSFNQGMLVSGGGIFIGGAAGLGGPVLLTPGSGTVTVVGNLIQGNQAGAGDGGGIYTAFVNGQDVVNNPDTQGQWHKIDIFNNMIVNNVAGYAGGGIAMQDTVRINIINNTIANNDSTATVGDAFVPNDPNETIPQPAGVVARAHSNELVQQLTGNVPNRFKELFSNPRLVNNIIWHNSSFYWKVTGPNNFGLLPATPLFDDLAVLPRSLGTLDPRKSLLTDTAGYHGSNITGDPLFIDEYFNSLAVASAFDEGGNFIDVSFTPRTLTGNYHIQPSSPAIDAGNTTIITQPQFSELTMDFDKEPRPVGDADIGADEIQ